jgi:NhaA family Na+:H+ antiporter
MKNNDTGRKQRRTIAGKLFIDFFNSDSSGGLVLVFFTLTSIILANSAYSGLYANFWNTDLSISLGGKALSHTLVEWVNDALMVLFFLYVGLEIERELYIGQLKNIQSALLPIFAAIGGMLVPALIHYIFNHGTSTQAGIGIPMATDIAFALGMLSLLGNRVPASLKIFLAALAIIDDLGAILIIALFYNSGINLNYLLIALVISMVLFVLNRLKVHTLLPYMILGIALWFVILKSGIHATISGVILAFLVPFGDGSKESPSYRLISVLDKPIAFIILPIFALANTLLNFNEGWTSELLGHNSIGIILGLLLGKPIGILSFCLIAVAFKFSKLPADAKISQILGVGFLAGIGFTMSIFISNLAFNDPALIQNSKIAVLMASVISCLTGLAILYFASKPKQA